MSWTVEQYLEHPRAVLRCNACGVDRIGNHAQARAGLLRCWTCTPKPPPKPRVRGPKKKKSENPVGRPPKAPKPDAAPRAPREDAPHLAPLPGRVSTQMHSFTRAVRYQVDEEEDEQHGRLELVGLRTRNPLNQRASWQATAGTSHAAKRATMEALERCMQRPDEGHPYAYDVRLSRVATKTGLDDDGVTAALKPVRDAFAVFVRINDANRAYLRVSYGIGHDRVQGVVIEWTRTLGPLPAEHGVESFVFFDLAELALVAAEHKVTKRYWRERMEKRLISVASRPLGKDDDEAEEEAAYDVSEESTVNG